VLSRQENYRGAQKKPLSETPRDTSEQEGGLRLSYSLPRGKKKITTGGPRNTTFVHKGGDHPNTGVDATKIGGNPYRREMVTTRHYLVGRPTTTHTCTFENDATFLWEKTPWEGAQTTRRRPQTPREHNGPLGGGRGRPYSSERGGEQTKT